MNFLLLSFRINKEIYKLRLRAYSYGKRQAKSHNRTHCVNLLKPLLLCLGLTTVALDPAQK